MKETSRNSTPWVLMALMILFSMVVIKLYVDFQIQKQVGLQVAERLHDFKKANPIPRIKAIDTSAFAQKMREENYSEERIFRGMFVLSELLKKDGYMVIEANELLTFPESMMMQYVDIDTIESLAKKNNIDPNTVLKGQLEKIQKEAAATVNSLGVIGE